MPFALNPVGRMTVSTLNQSNEVQPRSSTSLPSSTRLASALLSGLPSPGDDRVGAKRKRLEDVIDRIKSKQLDASAKWKAPSNVVAVMPNAKRNKPDRMVRAARGFVNPQGEHIFVNPDNSINWPAYNLHLKQRAAMAYKDDKGEHVFVKPDGSVDLHAYTQHIERQCARNRKGADGNPLFVKADGSVDLAAFRKQRMMNTARNYTSPAGDHIFVRENNTVDMTAYYKHLAERSARNFAARGAANPSSITRVTGESADPI